VPNVKEHVRINISLDLVEPLSAEAKKNNESLTRLIGRVLHQFLVDAQEAQEREHARQETYTSHS
jgi:hypothetical protein